MASTIGGDDPQHDLSETDKDVAEKMLREEARALLSGKNNKARGRKLNQANEISRKKAKRSRQGTD